MAESTTIETTINDAPAEASGRARLTFNLDVDICVVGGGLAGLTVAREAAKMGASVVLLEGRHIGWGASGHNLGTVMPGYDVSIADLIERVGTENAKELWLLAQEGADYVRETVTGNTMPGDTMPGVASFGALEVSNIPADKRLIDRLQILNEDFKTNAQSWDIDRVRSVLKTNHYFHGVHYPSAFLVDAKAYVHGLAALAEQAGVRIFEETPVVSIDAAGIRKRVITPSARLRCAHVVLAGNVHLGAPAKRLSATLLPVWRHAALTEPLGDKLRDVIAYKGAVTGADGIDQFRIVNGDRLLWSGPETTWEADPRRLAGFIRRRIASVFPQLDSVQIADCWSGAIGQTVHGMPQIGELRLGLWVVSGFGRQGLSTTAMGGQLIARSIVSGDDRWRLFSPFELVWAGGTVGRIAGQTVGIWSRRRSATVGALARYQERAHKREQIRKQAKEQRIAEAKARKLRGRSMPSAPIQPWNDRPWDGR